MKIGQALTQAMEMWIKLSKVRKRGSLLDLETFNWGKGTEKVSTEIDTITYG
jgi:hypothetical protein